MEILEELDNMHLEREKNSPYKIFLAKTCLGMEELGRMILYKHEMVTRGKRNQPRTEKNEQMEPSTSNVRYDRSTV